VEDEELSSDDDGASRPPPRTTSRRTAGGTVTFKTKPAILCTSHVDMSLALLLILYFVCLSPTSTS
jgi:hypothetical protein